MTSLTSCFLDPTLEVKFVNGTVTKMIDIDKCVISGIYHYQPLTKQEIKNFSYIKQNSLVRVVIYRKKNSNENWKVANCILSKDNGHGHQTNLQNESIPVHLKNGEIDETNENYVENFMNFEVVGDTPKVVHFGRESTLQILFKNISYFKEQELLDYQIMQTNKTQLSIVNKVQLPLIIGIQSQHIFDIKITGKYLGRSSEKVEFIFKDITHKVDININITDSRVIIPCNTKFNPRKDINMQRVFELQNESVIKGIHGHKQKQFSSVRTQYLNIPPSLKNCYWKDDEKCIMQREEIQENINKLYPVAFENLNYHNYKSKWHTLLFMEEIEIFISLQKYAQERTNFETHGEYLVLKIPNLSEQRPSLVSGDCVIVTDPPNCTERLGKIGKYEGIIHKVLANEIWLKFNPEFHSICREWNYSVNFFHSGKIFRRQHEVIDELWNKNRLGESFLFPYINSLEYQPSKLEIISLNENNADTKGRGNFKKPKPKFIRNIRWINENLNKEQKTAIINILKGEGRPMPYIIYGPPGTGKTMTVVEAVLQVYKEFRQSKLLVCAHTNSAVDTLLGKLVDTGLFDKTVMRRLVSYSHFTSQSYDMDLAKYFSLPALTDPAHQFSEKYANVINKTEILKLRIVITTEGTTGILYMMGLKSGVFSHVFIDEAGQSTEPEILLPLYLNNNGQVILAGDPKQLGPVIISSLAKKHGLGQSMLNRFITYPLYQRDLNIFPEHNGYNPKVISHLIYNYRSLPEIVNLFSDLFYKSFLVATKIDDDEEERLMLKNLNENSHWNIGCEGPIIVHGIESEDRQEPNSPSWFNPHEAFQVMLYVTKLMRAGILVDDIGIITPYAFQVSKIKELLKKYSPNINLPKVGTVEKFQGQEKMVIIISIVRSKSAVARENDKKFNIGFLADKERTNVALSRARALLIIVGDPSTMVLDKKWKKVLSNAVLNNNYLGCNVLAYDLKCKKKKT